MPPVPQCGQVNPPPPSTWIVLPAPPLQQILNGITRVSGTK
ncbi:hypothetical protein EZW87_09330 [Salmonella enterica subsp. enterica serovar Muenchen]|nr:hypothetical protein [Salmonella enterica subsp. enterica serovar Muenchen]EBN2842473.1 hypothetical protein [Salmonella enterica]ECG4056402.1 hypothetical protein [Salmonella enterica subsp. enterica serovar Muenchen]EDR2882030.1 hypothetical protein [Salmonella enterica subsp. enterica]HAK7943519.1 hypothetical protein [Salmonella enterica]